MLYFMKMFGVTFHHRFCAASIITDIQITVSLSHGACEMRP